MLKSGNSAQKTFSDKYVRMHDKKYQSLPLRPRNKKDPLSVYRSIYPRGMELPKPSTMEEASRTVCIFYPDRPNLLLKVRDNNPSERTLLSAFCACPGVSVSPRTITWIQH